MTSFKKILKIVSKIIGYLFFFNTFIIVYFGIRYQAIDQSLLKIAANASLGFVFLYLGKNKN